LQRTPPHPAPSLARAATVRGDYALRSSSAPVTHMQQFSRPSIRYQQLSPLRIKRSGTPAFPRPITSAFIEHPMTEDCPAIDGLPEELVSKEHAKAKGLRQLLPLAGSAFSKLLGKDFPRRQLPSTELPPRPQSCSFPRTPHPQMREMRSQTMLNQTAPTMPASVKRNKFGGHRSSQFIAELDNDSSDALDAGIRPDQKFNPLMRCYRRFICKSDAELTEPVPEPPSGIFGVPLRQSITYANVAISLVDAEGKSYIYGYVPIVVAKCGVYLKEKGALPA
jgi:GTPase-activating protein SAC7